jgi:hypothetical protein
MSTVSSRREEVLMHAARVILRDGLDATSLRRIAREGGFTTGVLLNHHSPRPALRADSAQQSRKLRSPLTDSNR